MHVDAKITSKNQITLPRAVRDRLGVAPGGRVRFEIGEDGAIRVEKDVATFADLRGIVRSDVRLSMDELNALIAERRGRSEGGD